MLQHSTRTRILFFFSKSSLREFGLRIIHTYGATGHGKGAIDGMSSFGVKNILRKDIVAHDIFFNHSEEVVNYSSIKCPHFNYKHLRAITSSYKQLQAPREANVRPRIVENSTKRTPDFMRQHLMVFRPNDSGFCREHLCSYNLRLQFKFTECLEMNTPLYSDILVMVILEILLITVTMKLIELNKYLTLQMSRPLCHSSAVVQMSHFIS